MIFKGICSNLETSIYVQNFCQIFDTWLLVKKNICGHLIAAQILKIFSDSVRELSESQLRGLFVTDSVTTKRNNVSQVGVYRRSLELLVTRQMTAAKSGDKDHGARESLCPSPSS